MLGEQPSTSATSLTGRSWPCVEKAFTRSEARALIISASGFAKTAIVECRTALAQKVIVLADLREIVSLLEGDRDLRAWVREKARVAMLEREPMREIY